MEDNMTRIPWFSAAVLGAVLAGCATPYESPDYGPYYASGYDPFYPGVIVDEGFIGVPLHERHFHHRRDLAQAEQAGRNGNAPSTAPARSPSNSAMPNAPQPSASGGGMTTAQPRMSATPSTAGGREEGGISHGSAGAAPRPDIQEQTERH
jgi:hypothetical protein